jgi:hypothetical protein
MKRLLCLCSLVMILFISSCGNNVEIETPKMQETLTVDFQGGDQGVFTSKSYSGPLTIQIEGVGQASSSEWSHAFYIYTDSDGNAIQPWHPTEFYNWSLWVNGEPVDSLLLSIPPYSPNHIYVFVIDAPGGQLRFAVGDTGKDDNSGSYAISILE